MWAWSYEAHIPDEYIPELWKLIDRVFLDKSTNLCLARIVLDLVEWSVSTVVFFLKSFLELERFISLRSYTVRVFHAVFPVNVAELIEIKE